MIKEGHRSNLAHVAAAALAIVFLSFGVVQAQEWPNKPVTMIVPLPAAGATDAALAVIKTPALRRRLNESGYIQSKNIAYLRALAPGPSAALT